MAYDSKCFDLAQYFLGCEGASGDAIQASLAQQIQDAVEDWFAAQDGKEQTATRHCDDHKAIGSPAGKGSAFDRRDEDGRRTATFRENSNCS